MDDPLYNKASSILRQPDCSLWPMTVHVLLSHSPVQMAPFLIKMFPSESHVLLEYQIQAKFYKYSFQQNLIRMALQHALIYPYTCLIDMQVYYRLLVSKVVFLQSHPNPKKYNLEWIASFYLNLLNLQLQDFLFNVLKMERLSDWSKFWTNHSGAISKDSKNCLENVRKFWHADFVELFKIPIIPQTFWYFDIMGIFWHIWTRKWRIMGVLQRTLTSKPR